MFISQAKLNRLKRLEGKTNKKGQPLAISNFAESVIELDNIMQQITITKRKEITKAAEPIALAAYRNLVPNSNKLHKFLWICIRESRSIEIKKNYLFRIKAYIDI